jgi:hypothetical protein
VSQKTYNKRDMKEKLFQMEAKRNADREEHWEM